MDQFVRFLSLSLLLVLASSIGACSSDSEPEQTAQTQVQQSAESAVGEGSGKPASDPDHTSNGMDDSPVLAKVNGVPITELDVELMVGRTFSQAEQILLDDDIRQKALESLVASLAIQQAAGKVLSEEDFNLIEKQAQAYKEELIVKAFLERQVTPTPVSAVMVKEYYDMNPQKFGGAIVKSYEMLRTEGIPEESQQDILLTQVSTIKNTANWSVNSKKWQQQYGLIYQEGDVKPGLLDKKIEMALTSLEPGKASDVMFVKGIPYLLRVTGTREIPPKPLSEVSSEIRRTLAPLQMRKAVREVMETVVADSHVEYPGTTP